MCCGPILPCSFPQTGQRVGRRSPSSIWTCSRLSCSNSHPNRTSACRVSGRWREELLDHRWIIVNLRPILSARRTSCLLHCLYLIPGLLPAPQNGAG